MTKLNSRHGSRRHKAVSRYEAVGALRQKSGLWDRHIDNQCFFSNEQRRELWGRGDLPDARDMFQPAFAPPPSAKGMDYVADFDVRCYLPGDILVKVDRASMANGLETRAPFLDVDLVQFTLNLPWQMRFSEKQSKPLLHAACEHLWPEELRTRSKQGFGAPVKDWMQRPEIKEKYDRVRRKGGKLEGLLPGLARADLPVAYQHWALMCLGLWLERHMWKAVGIYGLQHQNYAFWPLISVGNFDVNTYEQWC